LRGAGERKILAYVGDVDLPTELPKFLDDAPVVAVTSGRRGEIARHSERDMLFMSSDLRTVWSPLYLPQHSK